MVHAREKMDEDKEEEEQARVQAAAASSEFLCCSCFDLRAAASRRALTGLTTG